MTSDTTVFYALSSHIRRRILAYLSQVELSAGDIAERFDVSKPTISRHLGVLENARLVKSRRQEQFIFYSLNREHLVSEMYDFLADFCPRSREFKKESHKIAKSKSKRGKDV